MPVLIVIIVLLVLMWLLLIRPQRRRQAEQQELLSNLQVGDEIVTAGGIYGRIEDIRDDDLTIEIAPETSVRVARRAIAGIVRDDEADEEEGAEEEPEELEAEAHDGEAEDGEEAEEPELGRSSTAQRRG
jgi:preprotein translocase subunit YajC